MAMNYENLTREGLIYTVMHDIASLEDKTAGSSIAGDRDYILSLLREVRAAVDGTEKKATKINKETLESI